ncbi:tyrosine-type recombinase/integrase [Pedobacter steynii]
MPVTKSPEIKKGKEPISVPKGSTKLAEMAKNMWYIEYYFDGKQVRTKGGINKIKDPKEKDKQANILLESIKLDLANGYNPFNPTVHLEKLIKDNTTYSDAITHFIDYHKKHQSKKATIASYSSKLNHFKAEYPDIQLADITTKHIEEFIIKKVENDEFSQKSVKLTKGVFSAFFNVMIELGYWNDENPAKTINKKIKSFKETKEVHLPYSEKQISDIMKWLDTNDEYTALFVRFIYFTCMRPSEIKQLKIGDINLNNRTIKIRAVTKKVTTVVKDDTINIPLTFMPFLQKLELENQNPKYYVLGDATHFFLKHPLVKTYLTITL